jgi:hypothetical protein
MASEAERFHTSDRRLRIEGVRQAARATQNHHADHLREVFDDGKKRLELKDTAHDLATLAEVTESAAYNALKRMASSRQISAATTGCSLFIQPNSLENLVE